MDLSIAQIVPWLPFLAAGLCGLCCIKPSLKKLAGPICVLSILAGLLITIGVYAAVPKDGGFEVVTFFKWIEVGGLTANFGYFFDPLTLIMMFVVTGMGTLITTYAMGYMTHDPGYARFFAFVSLFIFSMLSLVMADNLILLYLGWEGVGLCSYLLIGFYYKYPVAVAAAKKAFIVNRIGDFGFALGIFLTYVTFGSVSYDAIIPAAEALVTGHAEHLTGAALAAYEQATNAWAANVHWIPFLLMLGAFGKSAQIPLYVWLPDAMAGPTPVSALIHAATMVTAGVFMVARLTPIFQLSPYALPTVAVIGGITCFVAATIAMTNCDLKGVFAYSTVSQLGYMFIGVGATSVGGVFHLFTHAFFKALLFLGAGSVIHAMHHEQDMTNYGNLRKKIPYTYWAMMIGTLAITGVGIPLTTIGFAGFLSKDAIIESAYAGGSAYGFWMLVIAAAMTSFYSWRLIFLTFFGEERGDKHTHEHAHESPMVMLIPLGVLSLGAVFAGMLWYGSFFGHADQVGKFYGIPVAEAAAADENGGHGTEAQPQGAADHGAEPEAGEADQGEATEGEHHYVFAGEPGVGALYFAPDNHVLDDAHAAPAWVKVSPFVAMLLGLGIAIWFYLVNPALPARLAENQRPLYLFLKNKWYFDELYDAIFVKPALRIGRLLWKRGDVGLIDGFLNGVAMGIVPFFTRLAGRAQSGFIFTYAFWMVLGVAALVTWMSIGGGAN